LGIKNLRYELSWGKPDALAFDCISGSVGKIKCDFSSLDPFFSALRDLKVQPLFVIAYCPNPLKSREGWEAWKDPPSSLIAWRYVCKLFAKHLADSGLHPSYEIWNEPDLGNNCWKEFFYGDPSTYSNVYKFAVAKQLLVGRVWRGIKLTTKQFSLREREWTSYPSTPMDQIL
jgi:hypothetical protein